VAIVPLAVPMLAGPGAITTVLVLSAGAPHFWGKLEALISTGVVMVATYFTFRYAVKLHGFLGHTGIMILTRLMGLLLSVIAVQYAADGLSKLFPGLAG